MVNSDVIVDEHALRELHDFENDVQGDRDQVRVRHPVRQ
eukprot:CAMPEP_0168330100 /NCGR_PEP_ID=MMETSP0213-20121227/7510_1 /TAXON_ID=151035 /ORGANISM="Euplotes harpa, Strain FSP1.4" /LENGTH=38 /DNA_ID= /DNA_START= /DNA_END= /DNA_ORIENTATION=